MYLGSLAENSTIHFASFFLDSHNFWGIVFFTTEKTTVKSLFWLFTLWFLYFFHCFGLLIKCGILLFYSSLSSHLSLVSQFLHKSLAHILSQFNFQILYDFVAYVKETLVNLVFSTSFLLIYRNIILRIDLYFIPYWTSFVLLRLC